MLSSVLYTNKGVITPREDVIQLLLRQDPEVVKRRN